MSTLNLQVIADGKHSVPTTIKLEVDGGKQMRTLHLPAITDQQGHRQPPSPCRCPSRR